MPTAASTTPIGRRSPDSSGVVRRADWKYRGRQYRCNIDLEKE